MTPLDLTAAFSVFPNGGLAVRPRAITRVIDADGSVAYDNPAHQDRVITEQVANGVAVRMAVLWSLLGSGGPIV